MPSSIRNEADLNVLEPGSAIFKSSAKARPVLKKKKINFNYNLFDFINSKKIINLKIVKELFALNGIRTRAKHEFIGHHYPFD